MHASLGNAVQISAASRSTHMFKRDVEDCDDGGNQVQTDACLNGIR